MSTIPQIVSRAIKHEFQPRLVRVAHQRVSITSFRRALRPKILSNERFRAARGVLDECISVTTTRRAFTSTSWRTLPRKWFTNPPPPRSKDDADTGELRSLAVLCDLYFASIKSGQQSRPEIDQTTMNRILRIFGELQSRRQIKAWTLYDSHTIDDLKIVPRGELTYFKGDMVRILHTSGRFIIGICRGRMGVTCVDRLEYGSCVRALYDFTATSDDELSFRKGQVLPVIPRIHQGWLEAFTNDYAGWIPGNYVEPTMTLPSYRYTPGCYQYTPLKEGEIRVLWFSDDDSARTQACQGDTIFLSLRTFRLDEAPPFTALSYCWGVASQFETVFCQDLPLRVTSNLVTLLRWFIKDKPKPDGPAIDGTPEPESMLYLWADAICINQNNIAEKALQVPFMRDIYGAAKDVKVYLGESNDVWGVLTSFALISQHIRDSSAFLTTPPAEVQKNLARLDMTAVAKFFASPAFQRSWMIQEMVLGNDVALWYGEAQLRLEHINQYIRFQDATNLTFTNVRNVSLTSEQRESISLGTYHADNLSKVRSSWHKGGPKSFVEVLRRFRGAKATDPRDKVYSLLGLADDHYFNNVIPDYSDTNTAADVFLDVANLTVSSPRQDDVVQLLQNAGLHMPDSRAGRGLPSWVPDWTVLPNYPIDPAFYSCSGSTVPSARLADSALPCRALTVTGATFDRLGFLGPVWRYQNRIQPLADHPNVRTRFEAGVIVHETLYLMAQRLRENGKSYPAPNTTFEDAVWQTLLCGRGWGQRRAAPEEKRYYYGYLKRVGIPVPESSERDSIRLEGSDDYPFQLLMEHFQPGRRVGVTQNGYFGTFPEQTVRGDVVAVLLGWNMPFVLRAEGLEGCESLKRYQVVGPCYVHGVIDGELIDVSTKDGVEKVQVREGKVEDFMLV